MGFYVASHDDGNEQDQGMETKFPPLAYKF